MTTDFNKMAAEAEAALGAGAAAEGVGGEPISAVPAVPEVTNAQTLAAAIGAAREAFCMFTKLQSPRVVLDDAQVQQLGALWGPVLDKHGINVAGVMGDYALEFTAIVGTVGVVMALRGAVQTEMAQRKAEAKPAEPAAADGTQA